MTDGAVALVGFGAAQVVAMLPGVLVLIALGERRAGLLLPAGWIVGTGLLAVQRLLLALAGISWTLPVLSLPWCLLSGALLWVQRERLRVGLGAVQARRPRAARPGTVTDAVVLAALLLWTAPQVWRVVNQPLAGWDAWAIWFLKGRVFFEAGTIPLGFLHDPGYAAYAHMDYPPLVPLTVAGVYAFSGDADSVMRAWWPLLQLAAAAAVYWGLLGVVARAFRLAGVAMVATLPELRSHTAGSYVGYADLPLAVFTVFALVFLYRWATLGERHSAMVAGLCFGLAALTKNEGVAIAIVGAAVLVAAGCTARGVGHQRRDGCLAAGVAIALALAWQAPIRMWGIESEFSYSAAALLLGWEERVGVVLPALGALAFDAARFNLLGVLLPAACVAAALADGRRWVAVLPLLGVMAGHAAAVVATYLVSPADLGWHLATSADRVLFQMALPGVLLLAIYLDIAAGGGPAAATAPGGVTGRWSAGQTPPPV